MHLLGVFRRLHDLGCGPAGGPIAQVPVGLGEQRPVVRLLRRGVLEMQAREFGLDHLEPFWGHEIVGRNTPIRQIVIDVAGFRLLGESLAHSANISWQNSRLWRGFRALLLAAAVTLLSLGPGLASAFQRSRPATLLHWARRQTQSESLLHHGKMP